MTKMTGLAELPEEEDGRQTPYRLSKPRPLEQSGPAHKRANPAPKLRGIYIPRADDQDYYDVSDVSRENILYPTPRTVKTEDFDKNKTDKKDKMSKFYKPGSGCTTKYFRSKRSQYVEHLIRQINVNTAKIVISEHPEAVGYSMPSTRSKSAPLMVKTEIHKDPRLERSLVMAREVKGRVATVTPKAPPKATWSNTGLSARSPRKERAHPVVERHLPEMPGLKVRMTWNTPRQQSPEPEENHLALVPVNGTSEDNTHHHNGDHDLATTQHMNGNHTVANYDRNHDGMNDDLGNNSKPALTRSITWHTDTVDAEGKVTLYPADQEIPPAEDVGENVIKKRQFKPMKYREKMEPGWKRESLKLAKERAQTAPDFSSQPFFKVSRPSRLHARDFRYCGMHRDLTRAVTSHGFKGGMPQCIMCRCEMGYWDNRAVRSDTLPAIQL